MPLIKAPKLAHMIASEIRRSMAAGRIAAGDVFPSEGELASQFKVAKNSVREAMRILESNGLIARSNRGRALVHSPNHRAIERAAAVTLQAQRVKISDVVEMNVLLEPAAVRLVTDRNCDETAPRLRSLIEREWRMVRDPLASISSFAEFHSRLIEQAGNKTLSAISHTLWALVQQHLVMAQRGSGTRAEHPDIRLLELCVKSHVRLVDLIEQRDGASAEAHWRVHMQAVFTVFLSQVGSSSAINVLERY